MKQFLIFFSLAFAIASCTATSQDVRENLPEKLRQLPVEIKITHKPEKVKARTNLQEPGVYKWEHSTTVEAKGEAVTIEEFGAYVWQDGKWEFSTFTGKPFTTADFEKWYGCEGGQIKKSQSYTDPKNWSSSQTLQHPRIIWYYIGTTKSGEKVTGYAEVVYLPELEV